MGAKIEEYEDGMLVHPAVLRGAEVDSYQDHRMVMSLAVAAMVIEGETIINQARCIAKAYPHFVRRCNHYKPI